VLAVSLVSIMMPCAPSADDRLCLPFRFLIADRGQQPPVEPGALCGFLEHGLQLRQTGADVGLKTNRILVVKSARLQACVARDARELAGCLGADEKSVRRLRQVERVSRHHPLQRPRVRQREGDAGIGIQMAREFEFVGVDDGIVGIAVGHHLERIGLIGLERDPGQVRHAVALDRAQQIELRTVLAHHDVGQVQSAQVVRMQSAAALHHQLRDLVVAISRHASLQPLPIGADLRRRQVGTAASQRRAHGRRIRQRLHHQPHLQLARECARQPVFKSLRSLGTQVIAGGIVERDYTQFAAGTDALQRALRLRAGRQQQHGRRRGQQLRPAASAPQAAVARKLWSHCVHHYARIPAYPRRGTEAVITAPTRNRMVGLNRHVGSNPTLSAK
jgi:hypothetical protein